MNMDRFRAMEAFVLTVKAGSFALASTQLNTSPQMMSKYIVFLENQLGLKLLNRTTRTQSLTAFGKQYYERCLVILNEVRVADTLAEQLINEPRGQIRISAPVTFGNFSLMPFICDFMKRYPHIEIDAQFTDHFVDMIDEEFEIVFRIGELSDSRLIAKKLAPYKLIVCASPDYLALHGVPSTPEELKDHECLLYTFANRSDKNYLWNFYIDNKLNAVPVSGRLQANESLALTVAAIRGNGIIMVPQVIVKDAIAQKKLLPILQSFLPPERPMYMLYTADKQRLSKLKVFIQAVLDHLAP